MWFSLLLEWNKNNNNNNNNNTNNKKSYKWIDESADFHKYRERSSPAMGVKGPGGVRC